MYEEFKSHEIANVLYATGSDILTAYGEKNINISRYMCVNNPRYYFQVNDEYVKNKLKLILFPFLHKGRWMRAMEDDSSSFKSAMHDINAPDLYIPLMAFVTYVLLAAFFLGINGKFSPESIGVQFSTGLMCWLMQVLLLEGTLHSLGGGGGSGEIILVPLLDVVSYAGYTFVGAAVVMAVRVSPHPVRWAHLMFCGATLWESFCMGVLLVKIVKRILVFEVPIFDKQMYSTNKRNYVLLFVAAAQFPQLFWLGNVH
ncbi:hypothetical protein ABFS82_11G032500 [Erythranthe guttata]